MKNVIKTLLVIVSLVTMVGCNPVENALEKTAEASDKQCPIQVDEYTTLEHVKYYDGAFVYYYRLTPSATTDYLMHDMSDVDLKSNIVSSLKQNHSSEMENFRKLCNATDCTVIYRYIMEDEQKDIVIYAREL